MGGGLDSRCVGHVYGADGAVRVARHHPHHHATSIREDELNTFVRKGDPEPLKKGALYLFEKSGTIFSASQRYARGREHLCKKKKKKKLPREKLVQNRKQGLVFINPPKKKTPCFFAGQGIFFFF